MILCQYCTVPVSVFQNFVTGDDAWPDIKTSAHKYGSALNSHTLNNRNRCIKAVHAQLKTTRSLYDDGGYMHWLNDVEAVVKATQLAYPTAKSTFRLAAQSITQLCEAVSQPELKGRYYEAYRPLLEASETSETAIDARSMCQSACVD